MSKAINNQEFILGNFANKPGTPPLTWNPDSYLLNNQHFLLCGKSGSGKTTLLEKLVNYLAEKRKHIYLFDLKGEMIIRNDQGEKIGNYIELTAWGNECGVNPFEFDTGVPLEELQEIIANDCSTTSDQKFKIQNGGPKPNIERMKELFRKNFFPNMGSRLMDATRYLFGDTYIMKGFTYDDITTWENELPSLEDTLYLIDKIKTHFGKKNTKSDELSIEFLEEAKKKIYDLGLLKKRLKVPEEDECSIDEINGFINTAEDELAQLFENYKQQGMNTFKEEEIVGFDTHKWFLDKNIEIENYASKEMQRAVETMESYIKALVDAGTFHSKKPPVEPGLNIINISGLDVEIQRFIVDVWLGKVFRACKLRGEYKNKRDKNRGEKCDTYFIVDESKLIAGKGKEKNDPFNYLNRYATEARSYGLGIGVSSQSAEHFPAEFVKNFSTQIVLNTGVADKKIILNSFGIDKTQLAFTENEFGNALIKTGREFVKIKLIKDENLVAPSSI